MTVDHRQSIVNRHIPIMTLCLVISKTTTSAAVNLQSWTTMHHKQLQMLKGAQALFTLPIKRLDDLNLGMLMQCWVLLINITQDGSVA